MAVCSDKLIAPFDCIEFIQITTRVETLQSFAVCVCESEYIKPISLSSAELCTEPVNCSLECILAFTLVCPCTRPNKLYPCNASVSSTTLRVGEQKRTKTTREKETKNIKERWMSALR